MQGAQETFDKLGNQTAAPQDATDAMIGCQCPIVTAPTVSPARNGSPDCQAAVDNSARQGIQGRKELDTSRS